MPFVDDALYYALDEKQHSIEMTEKGREFTANAANEHVDLFVLPDIGEEIAIMEKEVETKTQAVREELEADASLSEEKRQNKLEHEERVIKNELVEKKRALYNTYSDRAERLHAIEQLLKAYTLFEKDINYIVQEGKVMIVDEHTGRVLSRPAVFRRLASGHRGERKREGSGGYTNVCHHHASELLQDVRQAGRDDRYGRNGI